MSDYSFMRSGLASPQGGGQLDVDMMRKLVALLKTLMEDAVKDAERFVTACGRTEIQDKDIAMALKYETHEFFNQGDSLDTKFVTHLATEQQHTYETDDEEGDECEEGDGGDEGDKGDEGEEDEEGDREEYSTVLRSDDATLIQLHGKFLKYHREWDEWQPTDAVSAFMKSSVDKTASQCGVFSNVCDE